MTDQTFIKDNDYTLTVEMAEEQKQPGYYDYVVPKLVSSIRRTFNFLSAQVTTVTRDWAYQKVQDGRAGSSSAVSTTTHIQNFNDVQSAAEIKLMHAKLTEMGGRPPALEDVLPEQMFKGKRMPGNGGG